MLYDSELRFVCDTCRRSHIGARIIVAADFAEALFSSGIEAALGADFKEDVYSSLIASPLQSTTMYKIKDAFGLRYIYFLLPGHREQTLLLVGPYISEAPASDWILKKLELYGISPTKERWMREYFASIPVISETSRTLDMIDTLCERIWQSPSFTVIDMDTQDAPARLTPRSSEESNLNDTMISIKAIEKRYQFENELIDAVALGQVHKLGQLVAGFNEDSFEVRTSDRLRNLKNYGIIMNTLLRKAAERGGVHPIHIDRVSGEIAKRIERTSSLSDMSSLMVEVFHTYCQLVRDHSISHLCAVVQKAVILIDQDLSADLSLSAIAKCLNVSSGYLSSVFKREMGKTLSQYVREVRVEYAKHLLKSTDLQIQTVALHCGIVDVQYFTKLFKKEASMTPKEYRET